MRILQIVDVPNWAIGHLAAIPRKYLPHLEFKTLYVHPREVQEHLEEVRAALPWADVVDLQYWNTARQLLEALPELRTKQLILTHHNQKDLLAYDWRDINWHVVHTKYAEEVLHKAGYENVKLIQYGFDLSYFEYIEDYDKTNKVVGYVGRIVPWKGLKEIARACYELGYQLAIMGKMDKPSYWEEIPIEHRVNMDLGFMMVADNERRDFFKHIGVYVGNSGPNHEEGTMPLQEAMACGVPVLTTPSGVAADICVDHENALVVPYNDFDALKANLRQLVEDGDLREQLRRAGWQTLKNHTEERMAREFEDVYHKAYLPEPLVSVIIPATYERIGQVEKILAALEDSDYAHLEAVVCFDQAVSAEIKIDTDKYHIPIKLMVTGKVGGYNLAMARNMAVIEAAGELLVFCDSRLLPQPDAISQFVLKYVDHKAEKVWWYGDKDTGKSTFVENFSAISRAQFIRAGMFNERIDRYGGISQEVRTRFDAQGFKAERLASAKATQMSGSHLTTERRRDIIASKLKLFKMGL
jgi:glycosyltransferase involved in cell wall biosynthesis